MYTKCQVCDKGFVGKEQLKSHMIQHTETSRPCQKCVNETYQFGIQCVMKVLLVRIFLKPHDPTLYLVCERSLLGQLASIVNNGQIVYASTMKVVEEWSWVKHHNSISDCRTGAEENFLPFGWKTTPL